MTFRNKIPPIVLNNTLSKWMQSLSVDLSSVAYVPVKSKTINTYSLFFLKRYFIPKCLIFQYNFKYFVNKIHYSHININTCTYIKIYI